MSWHGWEQIKDRRLIAAGLSGALTMLLALLVLGYAVSQVLAPGQGITLDGSWLVLAVVALTLNPLMFIIIFALWCRDSHNRKAAEEHLSEFQERLRSLTSQLSLAEERERRRIAVYLHDNIGQKLAIASIRLGQLKDIALAANSDALEAGLNDVRLLFKQIIQDTKSITFKISSPILYELGLEAALEWLTEELQNQYGIPTYFEDDHQPKPLDEDLRVLIFQAVGELLMNVVKHARARHVQVSLWRDQDQLHITVYDDGVGFNVPAASSRWGRKDGGFGLFSIRERLKAYGGLLEVKSTPYGTTVSLRAPLQTGT